MKKTVLVLIFLLPLYGQVCDVTGDGQLNVSDIVELVWYIVENPPPEAGFTADPMEGEPPLEVTFTNTSFLGAGQLFGYEWDFDDGSPISTDENPVHIFNDPGYYNVCLTVNTNNGSPVACETIHVFEVVVDIDGNIYDTIIIGNQEWMAENLKVSHYRNGDDIPVTWPSYSGAYGVYNDDPANADIYGNLYNWYAVEDTRGVCPGGWHVPTDEEWMELEMALGMSYEEAHDTGWRGTNEGSQLAGNADLWVDGDLENNGEFGTSGFLAFPGGYRNGFNGYYNNMDNYSYFWSSTEGNSYDAWSRDLNYNYSAVYRISHNKRHGFSIRCIRDYRSGR